MRQIGINPLSWMNSDFPGIGSHIPVEQALSEAKLAGYCGVELEDPMRARALEMPGLLKERGLSLIGGWYSTELLYRTIRDEFEGLNQHMEVLHSMGSSLVIIGECSRSVHRDPSKGLGHRPVLTDDEWNELAEDLDAVFDFIQAKGFSACLHQHMGTPVQSEEDVDRILTLTDNVRLLLDTGHLLFAGADPLAIFQRHGSRVAHVHLKNVRSSRLHKHMQVGSSFLQAVLDGVFTTPGDDGSSGLDGYDFCPLISALVQADYRGWLVIEAEQDPEKAPPLRYAKIGFDTVRYLLTKAELAAPSRNKVSLLAHAL